MALRRAVSQEYDVWRKDILGGRVLIVGSGPSLDNVDDNFYTDFDVVACINHALLCVPPHPCKYFITTDLARTYDVLNQGSIQDKTYIPRERKILALNRLSAGVYLKSSFLGDFTVLRSSNYYFHRREQNSDAGFYYWPHTASDEDLKKWITGATDIREFPCAPGSSVFSAILFAARYNPVEIRLIGVDLDEGRSSQLRTIAGPSAFGSGQQRKTFYRVASAAKDCGVPVINQSWEYW